MRLQTEWTSDCGGKQDYDADLVQLSTRYWPRGGGHFTFNTVTRKFAGNETRPEVKPSASAGIWLQNEVIAEADFEAETETEVKAAVEKWAQEQFDRIEAAIRAAFSANTGNEVRLRNAIIALGITGDSLFARIREDLERGLVGEARMHLNFVDVIGAAEHQGEPRA